MKGWYDDRQSIIPTGRRAKIAPGRKVHRMRNAIVAILGCFLWLVILSHIEEANRPASQLEAPASGPPGCEIYAMPDRGEFDITLIIYGPNQEQAVVDLHRPGQSRPFPVLERYRKSFANNGSPYIHQTFDRYIGDRNLWRSGKWILRWTLGSWAGAQRLNLTDAAWSVDVRCYTSRFR